MQLTVSSQALTNVGNSYDLKVEKTTEIVACFEDKLTEFNLFYDEYEELKKAVVTKEICSEAKKLRLKIVRIRTATEGIKKKEKADYLKIGKAIDSMSNLITDEAKERESCLKNIENHFIEQEKEELRIKVKNRGTKLKLLGLVPGHFALDQMSEADFLKMFNYHKEQHESRIKIIKEAEELKQDKIKLQEEKDALKKLKEELETSKLQEEKVVEKKVDPFLNDEDSFIDEVTQNKMDNPEARKGLSEEEFQEETLQKVQHAEGVVLEKTSLDLNLLVLINLIEIEVLSHLKENPNLILRKKAWDIIRGSLNKLTEA